MSYSASC